MKILSSFVFCCKTDHCLQQPFVARKIDFTPSIISNSMIDFWKFVRWRKIDILHDKFWLCRRCEGLGKEGEVNTLPYPTTLLSNNYFWNKHDLNNLLTPGAVSSLQALSCFVDICLISRMIFINIICGRRHSKHSSCFWGVI